MLWPIHSTCSEPRINILSPCDTCSTLSPQLGTPHRSVHPIKLGTFSLWPVVSLMAKMLWLLIFSRLLLPSQASLSTSCSGRDSDWSRRGVASALRSWLRSGVTEAGEGGGAGSSEGEVWSWLWDPLTETVHPHYAGYNDGVEEGEEGEEPTNRRVVTVGKVEDGLAWQWRGRTEAEGWLYGVLDGRGGLEGGQVTFLYPDLRTGLQGRWEDGLLQGAKEVTVVAERCSGGVKELLLEPLGEVDLSDPRTMDPHERGAVYVGRSKIAGGGEGLFARRVFLPGDLISYFGGQVTFPENFLFDNMTAAEEEDAGSYFFNLEQFSPAWWGVPEGQVIDTPGHGLAGGGTNH